MRATSRDRSSDGRKTTVSLARPNGMWRARTSRTAAQAGPACTWPSTEAAAAPSCSCGWQRSRRRSPQPAEPPACKPSRQRTPTPKCANVCANATLLDAVVVLQTSNRSPTDGTAAAQSLAGRKVSRASNAAPTAAASAAASRAQPPSATDAAEAGALAPKPAAGSATQRQARASIALAPGRDIVLTSGSACRCRRVLGQSRIARTLRRRKHRNGAERSEWRTISPVRGIAPLSGLVPPRTPRVQANTSASPGTHR